MPLKIHRDLFADCPHRWTLNASGVAGGTGKVSEECCASLNGQFNLDFISCWSNGRFLVWGSDCLPSSLDETGCGVFRMTVEGVTGIDCADTYNGTFLMRGRTTYDAEGPACEWHSGQAAGNLQSCLDCVTCGPPTAPRIGFEQLFAAWSFSGHTNEVNLFPGFFSEGLCLNGELNNPAVYTRPPGLIDASVPTVTFTRQSTRCGSGWPDPIVATRLTVADIGPRPEDRQRSPWMLEYDTEEEVWRLHPFDRVKFPTYSLADSDPCTGDEKILTLDASSLPDGCTTAPATMTITRACPEERPARGRRQSGKEGKTRQCGCDCQDEGDEHRYECHARDAATCEYPESSDCCDYCKDQDPPCAYVPDFGCPIIHEGISIAAAEVVLRHECYFENQCDWVAVGPEIVNDEQRGHTGAEPFCASCGDECQSCCTWQTWEVTDCPSIACDDPAAPDMVKSRDGKCLRLVWGDDINDALTSYTPPGYVEGGYVTTLIPTGQDASGFYTFASADGTWTAVGHPAIPTPNSSQGCGFLWIFSPFPPTSFGSSDGFPVGPTWKAGNGSDCGTASPWLADTVTTTCGYYQVPQGCVVIKLLATWSDCP